LHGCICNVAWPRVDGDGIDGDPRGNGESAMKSQQVERGAVSTSARQAACLVAGCPCKDPRIVSHRRAAFFAARARECGETADRAVEPDPSWSLGSPEQLGD